jgi:long-chain acyl-CoA synthetase
LLEELTRATVAGSLDPAPEGAQTLPAWLALRAEQNGPALALRHKQQGIWRAQTWGELAASVTALVVGLRRRGFLPGDRLLLDAGASPAVFRLGLAVHWLGGALVVADPDAPAPPAGAAARFAFAGDDAARARLMASQAGAAFALGLLGDDDAPGAELGWLSLAELGRGAAPESTLQQIATDATVALIRHDRQPARGASCAEARTQTWRSLSHGDVVRDAHALLASGGIGAGDEALAAGELWLGAQLDSVLSTWLISGFTLSFVESTATADADRRELGPTLFFADPGGLADLVARTTHSLPPRGGLERRWLERALDGAGAAARLARRPIVHRLREVVGFGRLERAVVFGDAASARAGLQRLFGLAPFEWPPGSGASWSEAHDTPAPIAEPPAQSPLLGRASPVLTASSRSDLQ